MPQLAKPLPCTYDPIAHCEIDPRLQPIVVCGCDKCKAERGSWWFTVKVC